MTGLKETSMEVPGAWGQGGEERFDSQFASLALSS